MPEFRPDYYEEEQAQYDLLVHAKTIVPVHKRLAHDGMMYEISGVVEDVGRNDAFLVTTTTAADVMVISHRLSVVSSAEPVVVTYLEGSITAGGVPVIPKNRNRCCGRTASTQASSSPTLLAPGLPLRQALVPGGVARDVEATWVLRPETTYLVLLDNIGRRRTDVEVTFEFFEVSYTR